MASRANMSINKENNEVLRRDLILLPRNRGMGWNKVKFKMNALWALFLKPASWGSFHKDLGHSLRSPPNRAMDQEQRSDLLPSSPASNGTPTLTRFPRKLYSFLLMAYQTGCTAPPWGFLQTPATAKMGTERTTHLIT